MEALRNLTPIQWILFLIAINGAIGGSAAQLTDLFGPVVAHYIITIATFGNTLISAIMAPLSGQGAQIRSVLAMPGVEKISVNGQANSVLATMAVDPAANKIAPTPAAVQEVTATAKAAT